MNDDTVAKTVITSIGATEPLEFGRHAARRIATTTDADAPVKGPTRQTVAVGPAHAHRHHVEIAAWVPDEPERGRTLSGHCSDFRPENGKWLSAVLYAAAAILNWSSLHAYRYREMGPPKPAPRTKILSSTCPKKRHDRVWLLQQQAGRQRAVLIWHAPDGTIPSGLAEQGRASPRSVFTVNADNAAFTYRVSSRTTSNPAHLRASFPCRWMPKSHRASALGGSDAAKHIRYPR